MTERDFIDIIKFAVFGILLHILCRLDCLPAITDHKERMVKLKSTGIVRKVDELGRIVLPIELRRTLDIAEKDSLEIYMDRPVFSSLCLSVCTPFHIGSGVLFS